MKPTPIEAQEDIKRTRTHIESFIQKYKGIIKEDDFDYLVCVCGRFTRWLESPPPNQLVLRVKPEIFEFASFYDDLLEEAEWSDYLKDRILETYITPWLCGVCDKAYSTLYQAVSCSCGGDPYVNPPWKVNPPREDWTYEEVWNPEEFPRSDLSYYYRI